jgi:hypothetical protein
MIMAKAVYSVPNVSLSSEFDTAPAPPFFFLAAKTSRNRFFNSPLPELEEDVDATGWGSALTVVRAFFDGPSILTASRFLRTGGMADQLAVNEFCCGFCFFGLLQTPMILGAGWGATVGHQSSRPAHFCRPAFQPCSTKQPPRWGRQPAGDHEACVRTHKAGDSSRSLSNYPSRSCLCLKKASSFLGSDRRWKDKAIVPKLGTAPQPSSPSVHSRRRRRQCCGTAILVDPFRLSSVRISNYRIGGRVFVFSGIVGM